MSVEAYVGVAGDDEGLKLEEQVLVTSSGVKVVSRAPHDEQLAGDQDHTPLRRPPKVSTLYARVSLW